MGVGLGVYNLVGVGWVGGIKSIWIWKWLVFCIDSVRGSLEEGEIIVDWNNFREEVVVELYF